MTDSDTETVLAHNYGTGAVFYTEFPAIDPVTTSNSDMLILNPDSGSDVGAIIIESGDRRFSIDIIARNNAERLEGRVKSELPQAKGYHNKYYCHEDTRIGDHGINITSENGICDRIYPCGAYKKINLFTYNKHEDSKTTLPLASMVSQQQGVLDMALRFIQSSPVVSEYSDVREEIFTHIEKHYPENLRNEAFRPSAVIDATAIRHVEQQEQTSLGV